jgi:branched-chain amino acid transport system permease protein
MEYLFHIAILVAIYSILSLGLNLIVGYGGLLSVAQAAFFGIGAYATAIVTTSIHLNFFLSIIIGVFFAVIIAFFWGLILGRFRDDYFLLVSFGLNIIMYSIFINWTELTNGPLGITKIKRPEFFSYSFQSNLSLLLLSIIMVILTYLIIQRIANSSFGLALKGSREDEEVISVFGYNIVAIKIISFAISAGLAAIAGSLFATYITYIDPTSFGIIESILILTMVIVGGLANPNGSILGAIILVALPEMLRFVGLPMETAANLRQMFYGIILILLMFFRPQGILGKYKM